MLRQSQGSPCTGLGDEQGSSTILFICDTSVYSAGLILMFEIHVWWLMYLRDRQACTSRSVAFGGG